MNTFLKPESLDKCLQRIFYLALPPSVYKDVASYIHLHCRSKGFVTVFC